MMIVTYLEECNLGIGFVVARDQMKSKQRKEDQVLERFVVGEFPTIAVIKNTYCRGDSGFNG